MSPIEVDLIVFGKGWGDLVTGSISGLLVSDRFKNLYCTSNLVGIGNFEPVNVRRVRGHDLGIPPPRYWLIDIEKSTAAIDDHRSGVRRGAEEPCPACRISNTLDGYDRIVVETGTWKNEDIFKLRGIPSLELVTERFRIFCENNGLLNIPLTPATEFGSKDSF